MDPNRDSHRSSGFKITIGAFAATLLTSFSNGCWLMFFDRGGRATETGFYFFYPLLVEFDFTPLRALPGYEVFSAYHELTTWTHLLSFYPVVVLVNLLLNVGLLVLAAAFVRYGLRWIADPKVVVIFFLAPVALLPLDGMLTKIGFWATTARVTATSVTTLLVGGLILAALAHRKLTLFTVRACSAVGLTLMPVFLLGLIAISLRESSESARPLPPSGTPNVILVSIDTLRPDHLGAYGYHRATSPNIDLLAQHGVRFETVVAPTSWTLPSHMTLLTGLDPLHHGVTTDKTRLPQHITTLAGAFREAGYVTAGIVSAPYVNAKWGFSSGFDHYDDYSVGSSHWGADHKDITSPAVADLTTKWLTDWSAAETRRPFFLFLHLWDVHYDFNPPPPYNTLFDPDYNGTITGENFMTTPRIHPRMDPKDLAHVIALYDGEIRYTDEKLGEILNYMETKEILDQTIIAVTSDHGEEFFEHGRRGHRKTLYDEVLLVPLVIRYSDKVPAGHVVRAPVRLMDVGPTLLRLAGLELGDFAATADGLYRAKDLTPLIDGDTREVGVALADLNNGLVSAVRSRRTKLILRGGKRTELYDLLTDPGESVNLAGTDPKQETFANLLSRWYLHAPGMSNQHPVRLDPEGERLLRSLGYLQ